MWWGTASHVTGSLYVMVQVVSKIVFIPKVGAIVFGAAADEGQGVWNCGWYTPCSQPRSVTKENDKQWPKALWIMLRQLGLQTCSRSMHISCTLASLDQPHICYHLIPTLQDSAGHDLRLSLMTLNAPMHTRWLQDKEAMESLSIDSFPSSRWDPAVMVKHGR